MLAVTHWGLRPQTPSPSGSLALARQATARIAPTPLEPTDDRR